jgi:hypothetical protein
VLFVFGIRQEKKAQSILATKTAAKKTSGIEMLISKSDEWA